MADGILTMLVVILAKQLSQWTEMVSSCFLLRLMCQRIYIPTDLHHLGTIDRRYNTRKRARHSTCVVSPPGNFTDLSHANTSNVNFMNMEKMKQLPTDEKLNVILESMATWGLLKYRIDNIEAHVYISCASHEVADQRNRLLEYKSSNQEVRSREAN